MEEIEKITYNELMEMIGWFLFDLLLLGYVEDPESGLSFCLPRKLEWSIYIEVFMIINLYVYVTCTCVGAASS